MICKYCGKEFKQSGGEYQCRSCSSKLPAARRFGEECEKLKEIMREIERKHARK